MFYYENYLRKTIVAYSSSLLTKKLMLSCLTLCLKIIKLLKKKETDNMQCVFLKEIKNNIQNFESIPEKYALVLLKIFYYISIDVNLKNKTVVSSEVLLNESQRKKDINIKDAKARGEKVNDEVKDDYEEEIQDEKETENVLEYEEKNPSGSYQVGDEYVEDEKRRLLRIIKMRFYKF